MDNEEFNCKDRSRAPKGPLPSRRKNSALIQTVQIKSGKSLHGRILLVETANKYLLIDKVQDIARSSDPSSLRNHTGNGTYAKKEINTNHRYNRLISQTIVPVISVYLLLDFTISGVYGYKYHLLL